jgi:hypothetical protein
MDGEAFFSGSEYARRTMSARSLYDRFEKTDDNGRWQIFQEWVADKEGESLHLEFKTAEGQQGEPGNSDKANLARALSAFANTEGGVLVFGIKTKRRPDGEHAERIAPVPSVDRFAKRIEDFSRDRIDPPIAGIRQMLVRSPSDSSAGVILLLVPESEGGPHRATGAQSDTNDKYFIRSQSSTSVMSHRHLGALFSSRPSPVLRLAITEEASYRLAFAVLNVGRGVAKSVQLRMNIFPSTGNPPRCMGVHQVGEDWVTRVRGGPLDGYNYTFVLTGLLYPTDRARRLIAECNRPRVDRDANDDDEQDAVERVPLKGTFSARIDAEDMQPVIIVGDLPSFSNSEEEHIFPSAESRYSS